MGFEFFLVICGFLTLTFWVRSRFSELNARVTSLSQQLHKLQLDQTKKRPSNETSAPKTPPQSAGQPKLEITSLPTTPPPPVSSPPPAIQQPHKEQPAVFAQGNTFPTLPAPEQKNSTQKTPTVFSETLRSNPIIQWASKANILVQIGLVILLLGIGFLVKYASDQGRLPIEVRLVGATTLGVALAVIGWYLAPKEKLYGLSLLGGGIGIVYLTTFAAYQLYSLIPAHIAFLVFVGLGILYTVAALAYNTQTLAFIALLGGLLAPLLASDGGGNHLGFFGYYLAINAGILAIAWYKSWQLLNIFSFVITVPPLFLWGISEYTTDIFSSTELFLAIFFLFYLTVTVLSLRKNLQEHAATQTATKFTFPTSIGILLFANPLITLLFQIGLVSTFKNNADLLALTSFAIAGIYTALTFWIWQTWHWKQESKNLVLQPFIFLSTFFLILSIPLYFDAKITAAVWSVLALGLHWLGITNKQNWLHSWAAVIRFFATMVFLVTISDQVLADLPLFTNHVFIGAMIISITTLLSSFLLTKNESNQKIVPLYSNILLALGVFSWFSASIAELTAHLPSTYIISSLILFIGISCVLFEVIGSKFNWEIRLAAFAMLPMISILAFIQILGVDTFSHWGNWILWPVAIGLHLLLLHNMEPWFSKNSTYGSDTRTGYHAGGFWLFVFLLTSFLFQAYAEYAGISASETVDTWASLLLLLIPAAALLLVGAYTEKLSWPFSTFPKLYKLWAATPLAIYLVFAILSTSFLPGESSPVPYIPVLNPLTIGLTITFAILWRWLTSITKIDNNHSFSDTIWNTKLLLIAIGFVVLNASLARDVHHLTSIPFEFEALFESAALQTTYAIIWCLLSLTSMVWATHRGSSDKNWRTVWFFGASILALTIVKLFTIDLAVIGTVGRIFSFIGVGLFVIIIAYFAPLPKTIEEQPVAEHP